jgi:hypothetical protein
MAIKSFDETVISSLVDHSKSLRHVRKVRGFRVAI